jgi:hypothetical protein
MTVLLRAAERQHRAVVVAEILFHLHPVHVGNAHVDLQFVVTPRPPNVETRVGGAAAISYGHICPIAWSRSCSAGCDNTP